MENALCAAIRVRSEIPLAKGLNARQTGHQKLETDTSLSIDDSRPAKPQIVEATSLFSETSGSPFFGNGDTHEWFATTNLLTRTVLFVRLVPFRLGSLQLRIGSDVDGVAL